MYLYLVRHGEALDSLIDSSRSLSDIGTKEVMKVSSLLKEKKVSVEKIYHSGKKRAKQTAQLVSEAIKFNGKIKILDGIEPMSPIDNIALFINENKENLMLVGHLPFMTLLASKLTDRNAVDPNIQFPTGCTLCLLKENDEKWIFKWRVTPNPI